MTPQGSETCYFNSHLCVQVSKFTFYFIKQFLFLFLNESPYTSNALRRENSLNKTPRAEPCGWITSANALCAVKERSWCTAQMIYSTGLPLSFLPYKDRQRASSHVPLGFPSLCSFSFSHEGQHVSVLQLFSSSVNASFYLYASI